MLVCAVTLSSMSMASSSARASLVRASRSLSASALTLAERRRAGFSVRGDEFALVGHDGLVRFGIEIGQGRSFHAVSITESLDCPPVLLCVVPQDCRVVEKPMCLLWRLDLNRRLDRFLWRMSAPLPTAQFRAGTRLEILSHRDPTPTTTQYSPATGGDGIADVCLSLSPDQRRQDLCQPPPCDRATAPAPLHRSGHRADRHRRRTRRDRASRIQRPWPSIDP